MARHHFLTSRSRRLRRDSTEAERRLWSVLRNGQMNGLKFRRQVEIDGYIASGQWEGKAGGYGIQDNDPFVTRISGSHTNIVGLPMELVEKLLAELDILPARG